MWCKTLQSLDTYEVTRYYKLYEFGKVNKFWIHHISDATEEGYDPSYIYQNGQLWWSNAL